MGIIATKAHKLHILSEEIRIQDGMYSLNDLYKASGSEKKHQPTNFLRLDNTQELIAELKGSSHLRNLGESCPDMDNPVKTLRGIGTWVCKELVYAYAMWISPKFHLHVIRAFDQMVSLPQPKQLSSTTDRKALNICVRSLANARSHNNEPADYASVWKAVNGYLGVAHIEEATVEQVEKGIEFVQQAIEGEYIGRNDQKLVEGDRVGQLEKRIEMLEVSGTLLEKKLNLAFHHSDKLIQTMAETVYPALKSLNPRVYGMVRERMHVIYTSTSPRAIEGCKLEAEHRLTRNVQ